VARRRFENLPPDRQREILSIAAAEFAANGFHGTSYNQLLAKAGLGKGSAYYYFADKQDLFLTVVKNCYVVFFEGIVAVPRPTTAGTYWAYVSTLARRGFEFIRDNPDSAALLQCFARERSVLDALASREVLGSVEKYHRDILAMGQKLEAVRRDIPLPLLTAVSGAVASVFDQWFVESSSRATTGRMKVLADQFTDVMRRMLEPSR
jgi:AcrR family transcriptional regulator